MVKARADSRKRVPAKAAGRDVAAAPLGAGRAGTIAPEPPAIILVKPQLGETIGFAARAMANFGLTDLRLVEPRDGWPSDKAHAAAAGAAFVVEQAIAGLNYVLASTARPREMVKTVLSPESAARELKERTERAELAGVLFGPERSGLDNDVITLADAILTAPVNPEFASLSLPQAVLLFGYEWLKSAGAAPSLGRVTAFDGPIAEGIVFADTRPATREELFGLFQHLEDELDRTGFLYPPEKRASMVRNIRNMFHRMGASEQDVRTWRGIVAALSRVRRVKDDKVS
jgi:tRNA/rRNA methyltransferase